MYLLNLSVLQFLALFGSISAVAVALYLLDRTRRRQVVSTLRFWVSAAQPAAAARRRRIQQPWSLILQLAAMALLLLAIGQLRLGTALGARDHVLLLDTSAWMGARVQGRTLMESARLKARQYIRALPARDRVMLVRADALATPATAFEPNRARLDAAIETSRPGSTALNLDQALAFARHIQSQEGRRAGEIAFIGAGRTADFDPASAGPEPRNLRVISIPDAIGDCGLRKIGMRRSTAEPEIWEIYVSAHNYGSAPRSATLSLEFGSGAGRVPAGSHELALPGGGDGEATFRYRAASAGTLTLSLLPHDAFPEDDTAELELPALPALPVTVYSEQPDLLRPVLSSNSRVLAVYRKPSQYRSDDPGLVILDRFAPAARPASDSLWIDPPSQGSPIPVRRTVEQVRVVRWDGAHPVAAGLRTKDLKLDRASVFEAATGDSRIGEVEYGPVIVARPGKAKIVVFGFQPTLSAVRYELAIPLLFANVERWVSPEIFRRWELNVGSVGTVNAILDEDVAAADISVVAASGARLPFTVRDRAVQFFAGSPGAVRVLAGEREYVYSLTLPQLGELKWRPSAAAARGLPGLASLQEASADLWPWLALAGGALLLLEWILFGRYRRARARRPVTLPVRRQASRPAEAPR
jgi:hypothetical protein